MFTYSRSKAGRLAPWLAGALLLASTAHAQDNGIYIGGSAGDVSSDYDWSLGGLEGSPDEESAFKLIGGVRPIDPVAIEVNYADLGSTTVPVSGASEDATMDTNVLSVSAVGFYSLPLWDFFGRVGLARWESEPGALLGSLDDDDGTDLTYGVGMQVRMRSLAVRAEYEDYDISGGSAELVSIGFTYTFF